GEAFGIRPWLRGALYAYAEAARQGRGQRRFADRPRRLDLRPERGGYGLEIGEVVVLFENQVVQFADGRERAAVLGLSVEFADEIARHFAETARLAGDGREEVPAVTLLEVGDVLEDFGAGAHGGDAGEDAMQQLREQRVGAQAVGVVVRTGDGSEIGAVQAGDGCRGRRIDGHQVARA